MGKIKHEKANKQTNYSTHPASSASRFRKKQKPSSSSTSDLAQSSQQDENSTKSPGFQLEGTPIKIKDKGLKVLHTTKKGAKRYPKSVVNAFFKAMDMILDRSSDKNQRGFKNLKFHKLERNCKQEYALWLTANWRLIAKFENIGGIKYLVILNIEDYH